jgi:chromosome partitioning protein
MVGKSFAFMNLKGGVGKTVLTANIAREIVRQHNKKILLVDLDPQCSLSYLFAEPAEIDKMSKEKTAHETLYPEGGGPERLLDETKNLYEDSRFLGPPRTAKIDLVFGSMEIYRIIAHSGANEREYCIQNFKAFMEAALKRYDFVFVDTNPSTNIATMCALDACDYIIAPMTMDVFSVRGILMLKDIFSDRFIWLRNNPNRIIGIWNMVASRLRHTDQLSTAERALQGSNPDIFRTTLAHRIYDTGYLHYEGKKRGFLHDLKGIARIDLFNNARSDLSKVCGELFQRVGLAGA